MKISWSKLAKARMKELGISQEALSESLGVTQGAVGHWLGHRRRVSINEIARILNHLGIDSFKIVDEFGMIEVDDETMLPPKTSSLNERLKYIMSQLDLTQLGMARELNTMPQTVNNWLRRDSIRKETAQLICDKFGYSIDWLLHGIGDPKKENHHPDSTIPPESEWGTIEEWDSNTPLRDDEVEVPFLRDIELAAGDGSYNEEDYNGFKLRFSKSTLRRVGAQAENVLCFPARGNSMEPMIPDGAAVAVDCANKKIIDGKVYAINQDGWKRIKMLYRTGPNEVSIRSYNKEEHPDETANLKDIEIIGRMFWSSMIWD